MKKFINIILTLGLIAFAASCVKEYGPHQPGELDNANCYGVYFPVQEATGAHTFDPTQPTETDIIVARQHANGNITVPVEIVNETGIFNVEPITFADGQSETVLHITFPNAEIGVVYPLSVTITDPDYASKYNSGATSFDFSVFRVEWKTLNDPTTGEPAEVTFYEEWWGEVHVARVKYYEVDGIRTCLAYTDDPDEGVWGMKTDFTFTWNTKTNKVDIPQNFMGWDYDDQGKPKPESDCSSPVYVFDWYSYFVMKGQYSKDVEAFYAANGTSYPRSYYDPQTGIFYLNCQFYIIGLGGWTGLEYDTEAWVSGFVRTDYSLEVEADYSTEPGKAPVYFTTGVDTKEIKYIVVDGEITATQAEKYMASIAEGTAKGVASVTEFEYNEEDNVNEAALELSFDETGFYSVVAVSFDEAGDPQEGAFASLFVAAADDPSHDVQVDAVLEKVPSRYKEYDSKSALGFYIAGNGLSEVKYDLFPSADVKKAGLDAIVEEVRSGEAVSESVLEAINAAGGYASAVKGLKSFTKYTLVVWATNGAKAKVVTSEFATDGEPNEVIAEGAYVSDVFWEGEAIPTTLEFNPNTKNFEIPNFVDGDETLSFTMSEGDSLINLGAPQYTGYYYESEADEIYVMEAADTGVDAFLEYFGLSADDHSYYDAETGVYYFCVAYVGAESGPLCAGWEAFVPAETEAEVASSVASDKAHSFTKSDKSRSEAQFSYQREPKAASFTAKAISPRAKRSVRAAAKNIGKPVASNDILF